MGKELDEPSHARGPLRKIGTSTLTFLQDHPFPTLLILLAVVTIHAVVGSIWLPFIVPYKALGEATNNGTAITLYLGTAAASAIVAGFAGVIIIFTIGSPAPRLQSFRHDAGERLQANWIIVVLEPLLATFLGIIASITQLTSGQVVAPWIFELAIALLLHGAIRLLWILRELITIVAADDIVAERRRRSTSLDEIFGISRSETRENDD